MLNAPVITILLRSPEELRAKVIAFVMTANMLAGPLGFAFTGPALERIGIDGVLLIMAAGVSLAAILLATMVRADTVTAGRAAVDPEAVAA